MDAILFSANPSMVTVDDAIRHLAEHDDLYWEVGFRIAKNGFSYPMYGFMHISGGQVEYRANIRDIVAFSRDHYEDKTLADRVKPEPWLTDWKENHNNIRSRPWKNALVMTEIVPFSYDTYSFKKYDGTKVRCHRWLCTCPSTKPHGATTRAFVSSQAKATWQQAFSCRKKS